ncbi:protein-glutamate methylesterase/protein-glutamine glutaminase [Bacillus massiliigorillae]|uniref:protein-glutamate methylesterase/protein-glutamine glutaminase n=1 Tax=Bacillus massiliigorillae TaxID=1243664 RepID=UPI0003AA6615|nr:chemotaxis response regulator protein-glutamate methylesterase [Bacillus massiliigorillae]
MEKIKVLIVEDSAFMRKLITDFLSEADRIEVIGTARNGKDAIGKIKKWRPDVVTMDIEMPIMNGIEALKVIMNECPVPVIFLSSSTDLGADKTCLAMQYGAFDFIAKPSGSISLDLHKIKDELIAKITAAGTTNVALLQKSTVVEKQPKLHNQMVNKVNQVQNHSTIGLSWKDTKKIIAIGTSTGGPRALQYVLTNLPRDINAPIVVVQHMPAGFTKSLANRLNNLSEISVKEAEDGETLEKGTAYIAPGGYHLKVNKRGTELFAKLDQTQTRNGHRPSVDVLFESLSEITEYSIIAVIMTGMGNDGSKGLVALNRNQQTKCIAESEESSIVFGMPKAAIATNLVDVIENVENIAQAISKYC